MNFIQTRAFLGSLLFPLSLIAPAAGALRIELVEVPASEAAAASSLERRIRPLTLSEQYATTRIGSLKESTAEDLPPSGDDRLTIYQCRELLANAPEGPDRAALVIELARKKAYFMIDGVMVLETPVLIPGHGNEVPLGWFPISSRTRNTPLSHLYEVTPEYWMKLGNSAFGLHGDDLSGYPASGGCVRLPRPAIETVFAHAAPGTMVYICSSWLAPVPTGISEEPPQPVSTGLESPAAVIDPTAEAEHLSEATPPTSGLEEALALSPTALPTANEEEPLEMQHPSAADTPKPALPSTASTANPTSPVEVSQVLRFRDLLGGFPEKPVTKPLTPVSGRTAGRQPSSKDPADRMRERTEVFRVRSLLGGQ